MLTNRIDKITDSVNCFISYGIFSRVFVVSGNSGGLPRLRPLRTGLEPFDSPGSSSLKAVWQPPGNNTQKKVWFDFPFLLAIYSNHFRSEGCLAL